MPKTSLPTTATLCRFAIDPELLPDGLEVWTLDLPFTRKISQFKWKVEKRLQSLGQRDKIAIPYRQLNNTLIAVAPTLTHGFEWARNRGRIALAVGTPSSPTRLPEPEDILHIIRHWAEWWTERPYIKDELPVDEWRTMKQVLMKALSDKPAGWKWELIPVDGLLSSFDPDDSLNYQALPSLLAALLHGKTSVFQRTPIRWRKVQDAEGKKLSLVGFIADRPIWTSYQVNSFRKNKEGEGVFAYKLAFDLETQAGRNTPWMFVSLHIQRYGSEAMTRDNQPRRISLLTGANRARLDAFPVDSTLARLQVSGGFEQPEWDSNLAEILERVGANKLVDPADILANPRNYWRPSGAGPDYAEDEYYLIHAEGYDYADAGRGHSLESGSSMKERAGHLDAVVAQHLPMLVPDQPLQPDKPAPSGRNRPRAMRDFKYMKETPTLVAGEVKAVLKRALRGEEMLIAILWHNEDTLRGIRQALHSAFQLQPGQPFPENVCVVETYVQSTLLEGLSSEKGQFDNSRAQRIRSWRSFLRQSLPKHSSRFAIIELLDRSWQVKGAARAACAVEGVTSQMVKPIHLREGSEGKVEYKSGKGSHQHRAESVAREMALRHIGGLYGHVQEVYQAAGMKEEELEVLAFYLHSTQSNVRYPLAAKIAHDGAIEVLLPHHKKWVLYGNAAPLLGQLFDSEWHNTRYRAGKREIMKWKRTDSALWYDEPELSRFLLRVLKGLQRPTIVVIEADVWRWDRIWPQLRNPDLSQHWNVLDFSPHDRTYKRNDPQFANLLGIVRMRTGNETPQYVTNTYRAFSQQSGFVDTSTGDILHYFSIGGRLVTAKSQNRPQTRYASMLDNTGAGVPYKL